MWISLTLHIFSEFGCNYSGPMHFFAPQEHRSKLNSLHWLFSHPSQASPAQGWWILFNFSPLHWQSLPLCCSLPSFWKHLQFTFSQFSRSVVSDSLWPHGLWQARPPCPSPTLRVYSNSCSLSRWCHPTISSSVIPFSPCLQSFPASGSFPKTHFFASGGQSIGVLASASVFPMNIQDWFTLGWTGWISLQSKGPFVQCQISKHQLFGAQLSS